MDYRAEIINLINSVDDNRVLAFFYGLIDELINHIEKVEDIIAS